MRRRIDIAKNVLGIGIALAIAVLSGAHALSSASVRNSPELAVTIWPANGLALERVAYRAFVKQIRETMGGGGLGEAQKPMSAPDDDEELAVGRDSLRRFAVAAFPSAANALAYEPLLPRAHTILALSEDDRARQGRIIALTSQLNRRELSLQALVLQSRAAAGDYAGTIDTLDQILRVHPQRRAEFFPVLTDALRRRSTVPKFRDLLARPLPWRDSFLMHAVNDPIAARNLAAIRQNATFDNPNFDRGLIASLARAGDLDTSARIYRLASSQTPTTASLSWSSDYPPFDWTFANKTGLRAQRSKDSRSLEFTIDPGDGGVLASRLIALPDRPLSLLVRHQLDPDASADNLKLTLTCSGKKEPFFEGSFAEGRERFDIPEQPDCEYIVLAFSGRAWTGSSPLNGSLAHVLVTARPAPDG